MLDVLAKEPSDSFDAAVTDPPYALTAETGQTFPGRYDACPKASAKSGFMSLAWDAALPSLDDWREVFRVLKPGAHLLAFGGTRTYHRLATLVEEAGFEIRDMLAWCYWSGFPKSLDVSKAIDKAAGAERPVIARSQNGCGNKAGTLHGDEGFAASREKEFDLTAPATAAAAAAAAAGWGTALKPAHEPIVLARKPFPGTVAANVLAHGTGALNVDGCRIPYLDAEDKAAAAAAAAAQRLNHDRPGEVYKGCGKTGFTDPKGSIGPYLASMGAGRWPANLIAAPGVFGPDTRYVDLGAWERGLASGLFVCPKPDAGEREAGLREAGLREAVVHTGCGGDMPIDDDGNERDRFKKSARNSHPTVKPVTLMRWLVRLVTPPGGTVLEPFAGSGTTALAAIEEGCGYLAIEREAEYVAIAKARIAHAAAQGRLF